MFLFYPSIAMRLFCFPPLFFVCLCVFIPATAQDAPTGKADPNMKQMILDAIESNRSQIDSFEAVYTRKNMTTSIVDGKPKRRNQTVTIYYWSEKNGKKWRCDTETVLPFVRDGAEYGVPYKCSSSYDGKETRYLHERHAVGEIDDGNVAKENSGIVNMSNRFSGKDIKERILQADSIETVTINGEPQVKIIAVNPEYNFTRKIWLNPAKGYNIERAEFWVGEQLGELQVSETISKFGNAWIVTNMHIEEYSEQEELLHRYSLHVNFINYGKPISAKIFNLEFPPETYVTDNIEGKEYQVPYTFESNQAGSNIGRTVWMLVNIVILGILVWIWLLRKKSRQSH